MVEHQGPRRHAACKIMIEGVQDVTSKLNPYLISVQVIDNNEGAHDECHIELDDRNAELQIPPDGVGLQVYLGWAGEGPRLPDSGKDLIEMSEEERKQEAKFGGPGLRLVFSGVVSSVESGFGRRSGGRRMWIEATSGNVKGMSKEVQRGHWGEGKEDDSAQASPSSATSGGGGGGQVKLHEVMSDMFSKAGMSVKMSPSMMNIARDYWNVNDSAANFGMRMARENGGIFKIANGVATMVGKSEGVNADGQPMPTVEAVWGVNLIGWRIKPYAGRAQYGKAGARFFDLHNAEEKMINAAIGGGTPFGGTQAAANLLHTVADQATGDQSNKGTEEDSKTRRGTGWVLLNGEPNAKAGGKVHIMDARPGVDGVYLITTAEHNYTRGVGYTTRCNVMYPTPDYGGYSWKRDPGPGQLQSTDPNAPGYVPPPPETKQTYTAEELARIKRWEDAQEKLRQELERQQQPAPPISQ